MRWDNSLLDVKWAQPITNYEEKLAVAEKIAALVRSGETVGFGSGSTSFLAVKAIALRAAKENLNFFAIPSSGEIKTVCAALGIATLSIAEAKPDWCFDGADEIDPNGWMIKGRGGAMFNEKLIISNSPKTYILADKTKFVKKLCEKFPIPVECAPLAVTSVKNALLRSGARDVQLRPAGASKDGPVITENGNYILDARFDAVGRDLETEIKSICGVIESGLFIGYNLEIVSCDK